MKKNTVGYSSSYYMHTANALAREERYEQEAMEQVQAKPVVRKKPFVVLVMPNLVSMLCVFALGFALVGQYIYIQSYGYAISQSKSELNAALAENEKLKQQYAAKGNLGQIEEYAVNQLGMEKPTSDNIIYLREYETTAQNDIANAEQAHAVETDVPKGIRNAIVGIINRLGS